MTSPSGGWNSTAVGYNSSPNCDVMTATMVMRLWRLAMSFCTMNAGCLFWISAPMVGSKVTRETSPRLGRVTFGRRAMRLRRPYRRTPLRTHGRLPKRSLGGLLRYGRCLRPVMPTAARSMVYHQREECYERRTGAHLCRITAGHRGVCQHDTPATTGLEWWGDWRSRWGGPGGDHGRQSRPGGRHWWGRWGGDWGADQIAPDVRQAADAP